MSNLEKSKVFYETFLDLHMIDRFQFMNEEIVFLKGKEVCIELIQNVKAQLTNPSHLAFEVEDITKCVLHFKEQGFSPSEGPYFLNNNWKTVFYEGPDGEILEFIQVS